MEMINNWGSMQPIGDSQNVRSYRLQGVIMVCFCKRIAIRVLLEGKDNSFYLDSVGH
jgi:hypothetical protein